VICCSFIFQAGEYDEEFHRLDNAIDIYAKALDGYIKVEKWFSSDKKTQNSMYYFTDMQTVEKLANLPAHLKAKEEVDRWYIDYEVEVYEVLKTYGKATRG
jgi:heme-degrading monooxygenase HmoA